MKLCPPSEPIGRSSSAQAGSGRADPAGQALPAHGNGAHCASQQCVNVELLLSRIADGAVPETCGELISEVCDE